MTDDNSDWSRKAYVTEQLVTMQGTQEARGVHGIAVTY
jgi:hypothetical protein